METMTKTQRTTHVPLVIQAAAAARIELEVKTTARRAANMAGDAATWWASYPGREVTVEDLVATVYRWIDFQEVTT